MKYIKENVTESDVYAGAILRRKTIDAANIDYIMNVASMMMDLLNLVQI